MDEIAAAIGSGTGAVDRQGLAFEPFDIDGTNDELVTWGEKHMDTMGQRRWREAPGLDSASPQQHCRGSRQALRIRHIKPFIPSLSRLGGPSRFPSD